MPGIYSVFPKYLLNELNNEWVSNSQGKFVNLNNLLHLVDEDTWALRTKYFAKVKAAPKCQC